MHGSVAGSRLGSLILAIGGLQALCAQEPPASPPISRPAAGPQLIVVRLSEEWFTSRIDKEIEEDSPVDQVILGTRVRGTARTLGKPTVRLDRDPDNASLQVVFTGTTTSRTIGRNGPAVIYSRSLTQFTATKRIAFEAGKGFYALPAEIQATTRTTTEDIRSTRRGLVGRLVVRRAWRKVAENKPLTTEIARRSAQARIRAAFDRQMEAMLAQLNRAADLRETLAMLRGGSGEARYLCRSTENYVEFVSRPPNGEACPPGPPALGNFEAPIQVWVHRSLIPGDLAPAIAQVRLVRSAVEELVERVTKVVPVSLEEPAVQDRPPTKAPAVQYQFVDDWTVLSWDDTSPAVSIAAFAKPSARPVYR